MSACWVSFKVALCVLVGSFILKFETIHSESVVNLSLFSAEY